ncbi:hypothetical protein HZA33_04060 [Candidatus Pacearchaeota archaeon]|nr:hypothetical protein [Candidatus Pacearchaeota archaeon]
MKNLTELIKIIALGTAFAATMAASAYSGAKYWENFDYKRDILEKEKRLTELIKKDPSGFEIGYLEMRKALEGKR